jgi:hypothetical protein
MLFGYVLGRLGGLVVVAHKVVFVPIGKSFCLAY